jgi:hypothetical protein
MTREQAQRIRELIACPLVKCYPADCVRPYSLIHQRRSAPARARYLIVKARVSEERIPTLAD